MCGKYRDTITAVFYCVFFFVYLTYYLYCGTFTFRTSGNGKLLACCSCTKYVFCVGPVSATRCLGSQGEEKQEEETKTVSHQTKYNYRQETCVYLPGASPESRHLASRAKMYRNLAINARSALSRDMGRLQVLNG